MITNTVRFVSIKTAAQLTGLSQYYVRNGCRTGSIPHIMSGNRYKVDLLRFERQIDELNQEGAERD